MPAAILGASLALIYQAPASAHTTTTTTAPTTPLTGQGTYTEPGCIVTWQETLPDGSTTTDKFGGRCGEAQAIAKQRPGATVTQTTMTFTYGPGGTR